MYTAELEQGMHVDTPLGPATVVTNQPVYSRKGTYYWRTVLLVNIDQHAVLSAANYPWAECLSD